MILYALGRLSRGEGRLIPYREVDPDLRRLLIEFGPRRKTYHPELPFWHLQSDGLWQLEDADILEFRKGHSSPKKSELLKHDVSGGFPAQIHLALQTDPGLLQEIAELVLENHFPSSMHDEILDAVGLQFGTMTRAAKRNPKFRLQVLRAYEYRCAVCGFELRLDNNDLALEAAHIKWRQTGGPDETVNGLALCVLHHKLFDRGAFTVATDYTVQVSQDVHGNYGLEWLLNFQGHPIAEPQSSVYRAHPRFLRWHGKEVFRAPARER